MAISETKDHTRMQDGSLEYVPVVRTSTAHGKEKDGRLQPRKITSLNETSSEDNFQTK